MAVQTDKLRQMFDSDSKLMLDALSTLVGDMCAGEYTGDQVDRAFRAAHSIKSEAGFLQLTGVSDAAHALEESLSTIRSTGGPISSAAGSRLTKELDRLTAEINDYRAASAAPEVPLSAESSQAVTSEPLGAAEMGMLREARGRNERLYRVSVVLTCEPAFYYPRAFLVVNNLELECGVIQTSPSLESFKDGSDGRLTILLTTGGSEKSLRALLSIDEVEVTDLTELAYEEIETMVEPERGDSPPGDSTQRVDQHGQDEILLFADEVSHLATQLSRNLAEGQGQSEEAVERARQLAVYSGLLKARVDWTSRVQLLDVVRELRSHAVAHAARSGKRIRFDVSGGGAVVFSVVADTLTDALLHLVRNSIDHGIETIEQRAARGKPPAGTIRVMVERMGDSVRIRVSDDGIGIDEAALRRRTGDTGKSLLDILSSPGFTMKSEPDQSSGRGVGLDSVVHTVRTLLSGGIELRSDANKGTVVTISVPTASRLIQVVVAESVDGPAAIPASLVLETRKLNLRRFKRDSFGGRYYDYRGQSLPLVTLFGRNPTDSAVAEGSLGMVVRCGGRSAILLCTEVLSNEAVVRDDIRRRRVYSRALGREIPYVFPPSFMVK